MLTVTVTGFQRDEVTGLLEVCADDFKNGDRDDEGWGHLTHNALLVTDPSEAVEDLRHRAAFLLEEGGKQIDTNGVAGYRSLRMLADEIEARNA